MGQITSGIGLISGIDTASLIDQLLQLDARPQQIIQSHNTVLQSQQVAFQDVNAKLLALSMEASTMSQVSTFRATNASSSNSDILTASSSSTSVPSSYALAVQRLVSSQQMYTKGFADSDTTPLDPGTISFEFGDARLDSKTQLEDLNGGSGVERGHIRITDATGSYADVDLTRVETVNDVVNAIMDASGISVTAAIDGDQLVLTDTSGGGGTLAVTNLKGGTTATDLGLTAASWDAVDKELTGSVINTVTRDTLLSSLNDGQGVGVVSGQNDLKISLSDGNDLLIDLSNAETIGDVLDTIMAASPGDISATISATEPAIVLTDNTGGSMNTFLVSSLNGSTAASDLGILTSDADADHEITGGRMIAQINSKLANRINGNSGFAAGSFTIANRDGDPGVVIDLSQAVTIQDIIDKINELANGISVTASLNDAGNGIKLTDTSGGTGNFTVTEGGSTTAADLGLLQDVAADTIDSGNLQYAYITAGTRLSQLNNGAGINRGSFIITDSSGDSATVDLTQGNEVTIQDVLDEINSKGLKLTAEVNTNGDGIILRDTNPLSSPTYAIKVEENGGSIANDLGLLGEAKSAGEDLDGSFEKSFTINALDEVTTGTLLDDLNGGDGVSYSGQTDFTITTADGTEYVIDIDSGMTTLQDVIDEIHSTTSNQVEVTINTAKTGLILTDKTSGSDTFKVTARNGSNAAEDLGLLETSSGDEINGGKIVEVVTLEELASKINSADIGVAVSVIPDGSSENPYRLTFTASQSGKKGAFLFDDGGLGFDVKTSVEAQDALVYNGSSAFKITSSSNTIDLGNGVKVDLKSASDEYVTVTVNQDTSSGTSAIEGFVEKYNAVLDAINTYDMYDAETEERGLLLGDYTLIQLRQRMSSMINQVSSDLDGQYNSLNQVGLRVGEGGKLEFDSAKFTAAAEDNIADLIDLFAMRETTTDSDGKLQLAEHGLGVAISELLDDLTASDTGILERRMDTIESQIEVGEDRIEDLQILIDAKRERLEAQYAAMEISLAKMQEQSSSLASLSQIAAQYGSSFG